MGYLNNSVVTVDAILTDKGRELLAKNDGSFRITQFALSDDEIDYTLYNPTNPSGSAFYGQAIENMPLLEAFPLVTQEMKYVLTTLPRGTSKMPVLDLGYSSITLKQGASLAITPQTLNYLGGNTTFESSGYTADANEKKYGLESKEWLKKKVEGAKNILVKTELPDSTEKYGRIIGHLFINDQDTSLNDQMIVEGYAWEYDGGTKQKNFAELDAKRKK